MSRFKFLLIALISLIFSSCSFFYPQYFINKLDEDVILKVFPSTVMDVNQIKLINLPLEGYKEENFSAEDKTIDTLNVIEANTAYWMVKIPAKSVTYLYNLNSNDRKPNFWEITTTSGTKRLNAEEIYENSHRNNPFKFWGVKTYFELPIDLLKKI